MGLIDKQMPQDQGAPAAPTSDPAMPENEGAAGAASEVTDALPSGDGKLTITPDMIMSKLELKGPQVDQLKRIVLAGMKIMFDTKTRNLLKQAMDGQEDVPTKLGQSMVALIGLLRQESKGALPPELMIPAGMVLMAHAAEFLNETSGGVTDEDFGNGVHIFVQMILHLSGVDGDKLGEGAQAQAPGAEAAEDPAEEATETPEQEQAEDAPQPPQGGLVGRGMR